MKSWWLSPLQVILYVCQSLCLKFLNSSLVLAFRRSPLLCSS